MKISTRGRYALRVMIDLGEQQTGGWIPLADIAKRQNISEKYLEAIVSNLVKQHFLMALRGKSGGYRLTKAPSEYSIASILRITEGSFAPIACLENHPNLCERYAYCKTIKMWEGFEKLVTDYFENITLQDLINEGPDTIDYVI